MDFGHNEIELVEKYASNIYFESAGTILTLITVGKYLEAKSKRKTKDAISKKESNIFFINHLKNKKSR